MVSSPPFCWFVLTANFSRRSGAAPVRIQIQSPTKAGLKQETPQKCWTGWRVDPHEDREGGTVRSGSTVTYVFTGWKFSHHNIQSNRDATPQPIPQIYIRSLFLSHVSKWKTFKHQQHVFKILGEAFEASDISFVRGLIRLQHFRLFIITCCSQSPDKRDELSFCCLATETLKSSSASSRIGAAVQVYGQKTSVCVSDGDRVDPPTAQVWNTEEAPTRLLRPWGIESLKVSFYRLLGRFWVST